ncbi:CarD family transcriptional regulator [uncultured Ruthenibacterium sp.]|uniref:CarD family transcriptional regulator n=1 Tax=uncultured Ruthenibacterium sp. TaxID=1905347 RepID=UPI00349EBE18
MFQENDLIYYGNTGVCRVVEVGYPPSKAPGKAGQLYYKLDPLYETGMIYVPVDTPVFMRPIITREQAQTFLSTLSDVKEDEFTSQRRAEMMDHYRSLLHAHSCESLAQLIKTLGNKAHRFSVLGRHLSAAEQEYKKRAENLLYGELAVALGLSTPEDAAALAGPALCNF